MNKGQESVIKVLAGMQVQAVNASLLNRRGPLKAGLCKALLVAKISEAANETGTASTRRRPCKNGQYTAFFDRLNDHIYFADFFRTHMLRFVVHHVLFSLKKVAIEEQSKNVAAEAQNPIE